MKYANYNKKRCEAQPGLHGICPECGGEVLARCGDINIWHWAHVSGEDCDSWSEGETEWHRDWKNIFAAECQEVTIKRHYGNLIDGFTTVTHRADVYFKNTVIEFQNSPIDSDTIKKREEFYGKMIWVINAETIYDHFYIKEKDDYYTFKWSWVRKAWLSAKKPIIMDFGENYYQFIIKKLYENGNGWGQYINLKEYFQNIQTAKLNNEQ